jgi:hypothetical protein
MGEERERELLREEKYFILVMSIRTHGTNNLEPATQ